MFSTILAWLFFVVGSISVVSFVFCFFNGTVGLIHSGRDRWNPFGLFLIASWFVSGIYLFGCYT